MKHLLVASLTLSVLPACPLDGHDTGAGDADGDCGDAVAQTIVEDLGAHGVALAVSGDQVAYVTRENPSVATDLRVIGTDGSAEVVIHSSADGAAIVSIAWAGDEIVFLETTEGETASALFRIAASGGAPSQIGTATFDGIERLIGSAEGSAFVMLSNPGATIERVDLSTGAVETVGWATASGTPTHPVIDGNNIYFVSIANTGQSVVHLATTDTDAEASALFTSTDAPECGFPQGGLAASPTRLVCGYVDVGSFLRSDPSVSDLVVDGDVLGPGHIVIGTAGETAYAIEVNDGRVDKGLRKIDLDSGDITAIACDLGRVSAQTTDGWFPNQTEHQIGIGTEHVVWIDERYAEGASEPTVSLRRAAK